MRTTRLLALTMVGGCVYFNAMYDANREYDAALESLQEQSEVTARVQFDSVIANTFIKRKRSALVQAGAELHELRFDARDRGLPQS